MTAVDYDPFVDRMIERYEGGYGWDAHDPGGPTKYGITCFDLAEHRGEQMTSMAAWAPLVRAMTLQEAEDIYAIKYATACCFNDLNAGCDCVVFDFGVNSGPSRAIKYSQAVVKVDMDGILGPVTLAAINKFDAIGFISLLCAARMAFLRSLGTWGVFGNGWTARVNDLRAYSEALVQPVTSLIDQPETYTEKLAPIPLAYAKAYSGV